MANVPPPAKKSRKLNINPLIVAAIKSRDDRTDRYGEELVSLILTDLCDPQYVKKFMQDHKDGCALLAAMPDKARERCVRKVLGACTSDTKCHADNCGCRSCSGSY